MDSNKWNNFRVEKVKCEGIDLRILIQKKSYEEDTC